MADERLYSIPSGNSDRSRLTLQAQYRTRLDKDTLNKTSEQRILDVLPDRVDVESEGQPTDSVTLSSKTKGKGVNDDDARAAQDKASASQVNVYAYDRVPDPAETAARVAQLPLGTIIDLFV
jgi:hypothetical protein